MPLVMEHQLEKNIENEMETLGPLNDEGQGFPESGILLPNNGELNGKEKGTSNGIWVNTGAYNDKNVKLVVCQNCGGRPCVPVLHGPLCSRYSKRVHKFDAPPVVSQDRPACGFWEPLGGCLRFNINLGGAVGFDVPFALKTLDS